MNATITDIGAAKRKRFFDAATSGLEDYVSKLEATGVRATDAIIVLRTFTMPGGHNVSFVRMQHLADAFGPGMPDFIEDNRTLINDGMFIVGVVDEQDKWSWFSFGLAPEPTLEQLGVSDLAQRLLDEMIEQPEENQHACLDDLETSGLTRGTALEAMAELTIIGAVSHSPIMIYEAHPERWSLSKPPYEWPDPETILNDVIAGLPRHLGVFDPVAIAHRKSIPIKFVIASLESLRELGALQCDERGASVTATVTNIFKDASRETGLTEAECKRRWDNVCRIVGTLTDKLCAFEAKGVDFRQYMVFVDELAGDRDNLIVQFVDIEKGSMRFPVRKRALMEDAARMCHANSLLPVFYTANGATVVLPMVIAVVS